VESLSIRSGTMVSVLICAIIRNPLVRVKGEFKSNPLCLPILKSPELSSLPGNHFLIQTYKFRMLHFDSAHSGVVRRPFSTKKPRIGLRLN